MNFSNIAPRGMVVTPHHLATQSALKILRDGGTAMEAMVSAAATIAVVYPHGNGIGGDGFWLIVPPYGNPVVIEACGAAGSLATPEFYEGYEEIPTRGPKSAITVAGTVAGWEEALKYVHSCGYRRLSVSKLIADAITYADEGFPVTKAQQDELYLYLNEFKASTDFQKYFLPNGKVPAIGQRFCQKRLADTLRMLAENGLSSFYRGPLAQMIAEDMASLGMPITESDLVNYSPVRRTPLRLQHDHGEIFNLPPPTQGLLSLSVLAILQELNIDGQHEGEFIHAIVEATKQAFVLRDKLITDPRYMEVDPNSLLASKAITEMASRVSLNQVSNAGKAMGPGDTVWMGIMDSKGYSVSFIQSNGHMFGSGLILPKTGILWHNRGISFNLKPNNIRFLAPGKKPFHTLSLAAAKLKDGRVMIYGTRGGHGQPQTQMAIFHRYVIQNMNLQLAVSAPRWIYGSTTAYLDYDLKLEGRFSKETIEYLKDLGHNIIMLPNFSPVVGEAGALVRHPDGMLEGAYDPRSSGSSAGF